jgi:hypothetical protein
VLCAVGVLVQLLCAAKWPYAAGCGKYAAKLVALWHHLPRRRNGEVGILSKRQLTVTACKSQ